MFTSALLGLTHVCLAEDGVAGDIQTQLDAAGGQAGLQSQDPRDTIFSIIRSALSLLGIVFILLTIYAGFLWMTAGGDEGNIDKAKSILTAAVIGLAIIFLSYAITLFVFRVVLVDTEGINKMEYGYPQ